MPKPPLPVRPLVRNRESGFTLIELLVVIGIIVVLMGILIPVAGHVRTSAYVASTQSQLLVIQSGIEAYRQVFESYPGPVADANLKGSTTPLPIAGVGGPITSTENLSLGVLGGLQRNAAGAITYTNTLVGGGPASLNVLKPQRYQAFVDPVAAGLDPVKNGNAWLAWSNSTHTNVSFQNTYTDTVVPEFVDRFPDALPILYIRARVGASGTVTDGATIYPAGSTPAYNRKLLEIYTFPKLPMPPSPNPPFTPATPPGFAMYAAEYFGSLADPRVPRQKDGYMLISAGADRIYGTADDQTNTGKLK